MFVEDAGLRFEPHVPRDWQMLRFSVLWRGSQLRVAAVDNAADVTTESVGQRPVRVRVGPAE
jgi:trehalose/maltose hydrolase-like predicted phosphorylase